MHTSTIFRILGLLLMLLSLSFITPLLVEFIYRDGSFLPFSHSFIISFGLGFILWFLSRKSKQPLRTVDGFLLVLLFWLTASLVSTLPFYCTKSPNISFTNAFFEAISGITTTGASILTGLDQLPHSILYYRQQLQFLGGISIIIVAVAILPTLGIGGMQLFRTEISGPVKDDKLIPRITQTAKAMWIVYTIMTLLCAGCYWLAGMSLFDAIGHSFGTVSTGGFSTHDASIGYYANSYIKIVAMIFMLLGAMSFRLHSTVFKKKNVRLYLQDPELRWYLKFIMSISLLLFTVLIMFPGHSKPSRLGLDTFFQTISFITTSGYISTDFSSWPLFVPMSLLFCGIIGGCAGSTSGGMKVIRVILLQKQCTREIKRLIHPHGQYVIKLDHKPINARIIESILGFFAFYAVTFTLLLLLLLFAEHDFLTNYSALIATFSNTGRGLGQVSQNFYNFCDYTKWILSCAMLMGRLEIFTILVLCSPTFWRH